MEITSETVNKIANLAQLNITESENEKFVKDFQNIVAFVEKLNDLDTSDVEPLEQITDAKTTLRNDNNISEFSTQEMLSNCPSQGQNLIRVPKIIES